MASQQDIKRRIRSVQNTRKITKAMELVSAAKLRRAQTRIEALRPFAERTQDLMVEAAARANVHGQVLLAKREIQTVGILVITGDRGLAGAFNAQVVRRALQLGAEHAERGHAVRYLAVGRKGLGTLRFRRLEIAESWTGFSDRPEYADAETIAAAAVERFKDGELDHVVMISNDFVSAIAQRVETRELLPIPEGELGELDPKERAAQGEMLFEPGADEILDELLISSLETTIYRAMLESTAAEHGARMTAMRNASENAGELIDSLTLAMNRARQAAITQEILEVVGGADALE